LRKLINSVENFYNLQASFIEMNQIRLVALNWTFYVSFSLLTFILDKQKKV